jgi:anti-sigma factor (TIGR02949 family)
MTCESVQEMLGACLDGELDPNAEFQLRTHLAGCQECAEAYRRLRSLKQAIKEAALYYAAPRELEIRVRSRLRSVKDGGNLGRTRVRQWIAIASVLAATSLGLSLYLLHRTSSPELAQQVVSSHIRAMLGTHLVDVPSSDQHTVKPWFEGKLDFSPPVKDLKDAGFVLVGGRIDYVRNRPVAALVYERRRHIINLFIWPSSAPSAATHGSETLNGFNLIQRTNAGMIFWAASDLNATELRDFVTLFSSESTAILIDKLCQLSGGLPPQVRELEDRWKATSELSRRNRNPERGSPKLRGNNVWMKTQDLYASLAGIR